MAQAGYFGHRQSADRSSVQILRRAVALPLILAAAILATSGTAGAGKPEPASPGDTSVATTTPAAAPPVAVGFNQQWDNQLDFSTVLNKSDLATLKKRTDAKLIRVPIKCHNLKVCAYSARFTHSVDYRTVAGWDFTQLDAAVRHIKAAGLEPVISFAPGGHQDAPGYLVDDNVYGSFKAYAEKIVAHLHSKFGPLRYSSYETEMDTSLVRGADGVKRYRYLTAVGFPATFAKELSALYSGNIAALNATYGTAYTDFTQVPVPDLGSSAGIPASAYDSPATHDLRRIIGKVSAERFSEIGLSIDRLSPGSQYWGPEVQVQSLHDRREEHTVAELTPVGPTLSDVAAQPGIDVLSIDSYRNDDARLQAAEYRIAGKTAARFGKQVVIAEVGDTSLAALQRGLDNVRLGGSNLHAMLVWQAKDRVGDTVFYGALNSAGAAKPGYLEAISSLFTTLVADPSRPTYVPGDEAVYYPEWSLHVVQNAKLTTTKTLTAMADLMRSGRTIDPVNDADMATLGTKRLTVFSFYLGETAHKAILASTGRTVAYQYASHRTGFAAGRAVDTPLWQVRNGFTVSAYGTYVRPPETVTAFGQQYDVSGPVSLGGWPFIAIMSPGANEIIATHGTPAGYQLGLRSANGSLWFDQYLNASALPAIYG